MLHGYFTILHNAYLHLGIVYWTVLGHSGQFGSIKRAYMTAFDDQGSNQMKDVDLNLRYISSPEGIAVDWVGRYVQLLCAFSYPYILIIIYKPYNPFSRHSFAKLDKVYLVFYYRHIYWTDAGTNRIEVAKLDGRYRKWLIYSDLDQPAAIVVNPALG